MKGEHRFDLKEILSTCTKCEYLVFAYFNGLEPNEILFRDLYDFFDKEGGEVGLYGCVEPMYHNKELFWVHNLVNDFDYDQNGDIVEDQKYSTAKYFKERHKFDNRRDAELELFYLSFRKLERILTDPDRSVIAKSKKNPTIDDNFDDLFDAQQEEIADIDDIIKHHFDKNKPETETPY